ncbi:MAG: hypothetical protein AAGA18_07745 [Verrucomicrobiota bacterium]
MKVYVTIFKTTVLTCLLGFWFNQNSNGSDEDNFYVVTGTNGWNVTWYLNDQPVYIGHGAFVLDVSKFVKNGDNHVRCVAKVYSDTAVPHNFKLSKIKNITDKGITLWSSREIVNNSDSSVELSFVFYGESKTKWRWEQSQIIPVLDQQQRNILLNKANSFLLSLKENGVKAIRSSILLDWQASSSKHTGYLQSALDVLEKSKLSNPRIVSLKQLEILQGTKLVLIYSDKNNLFEAESILNESSSKKVSLVIPYIFFIKEDDTWKMLNFL